MRITLKMIQIGARIYNQKRNLLNKMKKVMIILNQMRLEEMMKEAVMMVKKFCAQHVEMWRTTQLLW